MKYAVESPYSAAAAIRISQGLQQALGWKNPDIVLRSTIIEVHCAEFLQVLCSLSVHWWG